MYLKMRWFDTEKICENISTSKFFKQRNSTDFMNKCFTTYIFSIRVCKFLKVRTGFNNHLHFGSYYLFILHPKSHPFRISYYKTENVEHIFV